MPFIQWSLAAGRDVDRLQTYLETIDPDLAAQAVIAVQAQANMLLQFPRMGTALSGGRRKLSERRFGYIVQYRIVRGGVIILRFRHQREDWR